MNKLAKKRYDKALKIDPNNKQALKNLELLKLDKLKSKAYKKAMGLVVDVRRLARNQFDQIMPSQFYVSTVILKLHSKD